MATITSAHPVDLSRHMLPSSTSSSSLERTVSASSSATVHPLDSVPIEEEKASSSASSSSPTYQSTSSSSLHKTVSTAVSSINTGGSLSPPPPSQLRRKQDKATSQPPATSSDTVTNDYSWDAASKETSSKGEVNSDDRNEFDRRRRDQWNYDDSQESEELYNSLMDEERPMQYPPVSEEDKEARAIELNLERWASQEKLRRKAHRTSRISPSNNASVAPGTIAKRRSVLGMLSNSRSNSGLSILQQKDGSGEGRREDAARSESYNLSKGESSDGNTAMEGRFDAAEDGQSESRRLSKGKSREGSDPFRDPSAPNNSSSKRTSTIKPTSRAPIVTPGSAPTTRHRANERLLKDGGTVQMPSIVATDDDEEKEAVRHLQELVIDPFQSAAEVDQQHRYLLARDAAKRTMSDDERSIVTAAPPPIMAPIRKSTSSSKFNEIGLDDGEDAMAADWLRDTTPSNSSQREHEQTSVRKSWWTEWLCGCEDMEEEDDQQTGRTMPG